MNWGRPADRIHAWWKDIPGEHYWLDVTERDGRDRLLAAPRNDGRGPGSWVHQLITHVRGGDVVFHFDAAQQAIAGWSIAMGRVEKQELRWPLSDAADGSGPGSRRLPSWGIRLRQSTRLDAAVSLVAIARHQSRLFPALRALEDAVGDPLYYPFEMGNDEATQLLSGFVFKLPAALVHGCPELASAAVRVARSLASRERDLSPVKTEAPGTLAASR